jgi:hypothetical protein
LFCDLKKWAAIMTRDALDTDLACLHRTGYLFELKAGYRISERIFCPKYIWLAKY